MRVVLVFFKLFLCEVFGHIIFPFLCMVLQSLPIERVEFEGIDETECHEEDNVVVDFRSIGGLD